VVQDGRLTRVDEREIVAKVREVAAGFEPVATRGQAVVRTT